ncbi:MAG: metallopeptidase [Candidatus Blackburnbacteria bacterium]|nr:metallopeptidase [Candidatus Blackburnbacteria bacterium]
MEWVEDRGIEKRVRELGNAGKLEHVNPARVFCFRSLGAKTRAYARIWGLPRIFQQALGIQPAYVIEVISEKFDKLPQEKQDMVLIHELLHIPRTFSGALVPHHDRGGVNEDRVREIYKNLKVKK